MRMKKGEVITAKQFRQSVAKESSVYRQVADYLKQAYPTLIWRFDVGADLKLTIGQAVKFKALQSGRGWPDLFIPEMSIRKGRGFYNGMFLEIKKEGVKIFKKDGVTAIDQHTQEQMDILMKLRRQDYFATFAIGFEDAKSLIDKYLTGKL